MAINQGIFTKFVKSYIPYSAYATIIVVTDGRNSVKKIKTSIFLIGILTLVPFVSVSAQEETQVQETPTETAETTTPDDKSAGRSERLESYKAKVSAKLAESQSKRIAGRCKSAQNKLSAYRKSATVVAENRTRVYQDVAEKLDNLLAKMQKAELNTQTLETAKNDMQSDLVILKASFENYDTALADLESMDCVSDPDAFNAALTEARSLRTELKAQVQEFRQFATVQMKQILQDLKSQLENKTESADDSQNIEE